MIENLQELLANIVFGRTLNQNVNLVSKYDFIGGCSLLTSLIKSFKTEMGVKRMVQNHSSSLISLGWNLLNDVRERSPTMDDKILASIAIRHFTRTLKEYFRQLVDVEAWEVFQKICRAESGSLFDLMSRILLEPASQDGISIFYPVGIEDIESNMNKSKATLINLFLHFVNAKYVLKVFKPDPRKPEESKEAFMTVTMKIIESAHLLAKSMPKEDSCQACLVSAINYMAKCSSVNEFYPIFEKTYRVLLVDLILPHLVLTEQEREDFERNEVEYFSYSVDLVNPGAKNSETPKARAAKLLDNLCTSIDGCLTYVSQILFGLVDVVSQQLDLQAALAAYPILAEVLGSELFKKVGKMDILDMSLLTMAIISEKILARTDLR